jgi:hypothetical protein
LIPLCPVHSSSIWRYILIFVFYYCHILMIYANFWNHWFRISWQLYTIWGQVTRSVCILYTSTLYMHLCGHRYLRIKTNIILCMASIFVYVNWLPQKSNTKGPSCKCYSYWRYLQEVMDVTTLIRVTKHYICFSSGRFSLIIKT